MSADSYEHWSFYDCIWWGLMTLTTVGYHIQPQSFLGKLSCGLCALCGVFIITLPIPIGLTANVHTYQHDNVLGQAQSPIFRESSLNTSQ